MSNFGGMSWRVYLRDIFVVIGYVKRVNPELFGVCTREYVLSVCQIDSPKYIQGNMTGFYFQLYMSKEVVQEGMTKRVCSGKCLFVYIQGIFPIGSRYQRSNSCGMFKALHKGICLSSMQKRLSKVCSREHDWVLCSSAYVKGCMTKRICSGNVLACISKGYFC